MEAVSAAKPHASFQFEVEKIIGISSDGNFQVQWTPAWVSRFHLVGCEHLIQEFLNQQAEKEIKPELENQLEEIGKGCPVNDNYCERQNPSETDETSLQPPSCKIEVEEETTTGGGLSCITVEDVSVHDNIDVSVVGKASQTGTGKVLGSKNKSISVNDDVEHHHNQPHSPNIQQGLESLKLEQPTISSLDVNEMCFELPDNSCRSLLVQENECSAEIVLSETSSPTPAGDTVESDNLPQLTDIQQSGHNQAKPLSKNDYNICQKDISYQYDPQHVGSERPSFAYDICGKPFIGSTNFNQHMLTHTKEKPFHCDVCGRTFAQNGHLQNHFRTHTGDKPYSCEVCEKSFSRNSSLTEHIHTHTCEKLPFACNVCGKSFIRRRNLKQHMCSHTNEKPFCCEICGRTFARKGHLQDHVRMHTGDKPYSCEICQKSFSRRSTLKKHEFTHTHK